MQAAFRDGISFIEDRLKACGTRAALFTKNALTQECTHGLALAADAPLRLMLTTLC